MPVIEQNSHILRVAAHAAHYAVATVALVLGEPDALARLEFLSVCTLDVGVRHWGLS